MYLKCINQKLLNLVSHDHIIGIVATFDRRKNFTTALTTTSLHGNLFATTIILYSELN